MTQLSEPLAMDQDQATHSRAGLSGRRTLSRAFTHLLLIFTALLFLTPFYWLVVSSLKETGQILTLPPQWLPNPVLWSNYTTALTSPSFPFFTLLKNTLLYAGLSTFGTVISSSFVAYGFARLRFRGRDTLFAITLATLLLPSIVTLIPTYILFQRLGWVGTYAPLIVPYFFGTAFNIFLLRQFMMTVPYDLTDAARVDGAGDFIILWRVMLPLVQPALMVVAIFHFIYAWNDFFGPLLYVDDPSEYPLVLGLYAFRTRFALQWNLLTAAALSVTAPLIILFFIAQRHFIEGITLTGIKG